MIIFLNLLSLSACCRGDDAVEPAFSDMAVVPNPLTAPAQLDPEEETPEEIDFGLGHNPETQPPVQGVQPTQPAPK